MPIKKSKKKKSKLAKESVKPRVKAKVNRRAGQTHPDLDPRFNLKTRSDLYDQDYLHKLSPKELDWLNKFNKETISASFDSENPKRNLHKTKKLRKDCYDRNNSRNRDILTRAKASNQLEYELHPDSTLQDLVSTSEDEIIEAIDTKEMLKAVSWLSEENNKDEKLVEKSLILDAKEKE